MEGLELGGQCQGHRCWTGQVHAVGGTRAEAGGVTVTLN